MSRYLDALRDLEAAAEISEMPKSPTAKTDETTTKPGFGSFDSTPNGAFPDFRGFTEAELKAAAGDDWPEVQGNPHLLDAFVSALRTRRQREQGWRPDHYTQASDCGGCGPVWLWEGAPAHVLSCPWCWNRWEGRPLPEPPTQAHQAAPAADPEPEPASPEPAPIRCGTCRHFGPNPSTPRAGVGTCRIDAPITRGQPARWPLTLHHCPDWQATDDPDEDTAT